jgi:replication factor C small subunit
LELNASDERGIDVIRTKVKNFARTSAIASPVSFKILIMDEADSLTSAAQHALRRTMEIFTKTCRFALIGNYSERIIDPIQSRCSIFRFGPLEEQDLKSWLKYIAAKESIIIIDEGLETLYQASRGDLRKAINLLQAASATKEVVDDMTIYEVLGRVSPEKIREMLNLGLEGNFLESREILRELLIDEGVSPEDIIRMVYSELMKNTIISGEWKVRISDTIGEVDYRLTQGARPEIQLSALLAQLALVGEQIK